MFGSYFNIFICYNEIDERPQTQFAKDVNEVLKNIEISQSPRENIRPYSGSGRFPIFHVKIYKRLDSKIHIRLDSLPIVGNPGRHIVCGSLAENIKSCVDSILKPHMDSLSSCVKYTSDFISKFYNLKGIPQNTYLVTLDVTSLYSNIPHDDSIKVYSKAVVLLWFSVACFWCQSFGDVSAYMCSYYFSSVWGSERPPFWK